MTNMVTSRQIKLLLDFMEQHHKLASGHVRGKEGKEISKRLWAKCAAVLNMELEGIQKSADSWKKYYNQYKSRVKAKIRIAKQSLEGTDGSPVSAANITLTPLEVRLNSILGHSPIRVSQDPLENNGVGGTSVVPVQEASDDTDIVIIPSTVVKCENLTRDDCESYSAAAVKRKIEPSPEIPDKKRLCISNNNASKAAEKQPASMEQTRIDVDREMACAINRQAAATEGLVQQFKRFVDLYEIKLLHHS